MTLETFGNPDTYHVVMTACPYCSEPLTPDINFVEHWPDDSREVMEASQ